MKKNINIWNYNTLVIPFFGQILIAIFLGGRDKNKFLKNNTWKNVNIWNYNTLVIHFNGQILIYFWVVETRIIRGFGWERQSR